MYLYSSIRALSIDLSDTCLITDAAASLLFFRVVLVKYGKSNMQLIHRNNVSVAPCCNEAIINNILNKQ